MTRPVPEHGTYAAYQRHRRRSEHPCQPCRESATRYMQEYRQAHAAYSQGERWENKMRSRALWVLARLHPDEFQKLVIAEMDKDLAAELTASA